MAVHFLNVLLQTGEFARLHRVEQLEPSFEKPKSGFAFSELDKSKYETIDQHDQAKMSIDVSSDSNATESDSVDAADWLVFLTLETLGVSGLIGNLALLIVIIKSGLLERPSFIFIASLAVADIFHSMVTSTYFYPPIVLRRNVFNRAGVQIMNALDWTAWGVTLTHMIAICLDRLLAIVLYQNYARLVTVSRTITISSVCWFSFAAVNIFFACMRFCCIVVPQPEFYTFGFEDLSAPLEKSYQSELSPLGGYQSGVSHVGSSYQSSDLSPSRKHSQSNISLITVISPSSGSSYQQDDDFTTQTNVYKPLYVPLECLAMLILAVGNPVILLNLYEKYRRKRTLRAASVVLVEVGQSLSRQPMNVDASLIRDVKIFLQIVVVMVIFFIYMFIYYLFFYITDFSDKWSTMLNSICYSITHMINPIVYFSLNEQMQKQVLLIFRNRAKAKRRRAARIGRRNALCGVTAIVHAIAVATAAAMSESSPLVYLSSTEQEESCDQQGQRGDNNDNDKGKEQDTENEETSVLTPLLNGQCHDRVYTESYKTDNAMPYDYVEPNEEDAFL